VDLARGKAFIEEWGAQGASLVGVAVDQWLMGLLAVQDMLKPGVLDVIASLKHQKYEVFLVSGDNARTAEAIGEHAGIESPERRGGSAA
jgi:P-type E1-E2 ATPase